MIDLKISFLVLIKILEKNNHLKFIHKIERIKINLPFISNCSRLKRVFSNVIYTFSIPADIPKLLFKSFG